MKNRFRFTILLLMSCLLLSYGTMTALAETEGAAESSADTTQFQEMSMDDTLSSLKIAQASLSPEFSPNQLTYTATVPYEVERVALTAQTNSPEARKVIRGTSDLKVGENLITVTVTAENGSVREYRITLIRQEMPETTAGEGGETQQDPVVNESDSQEETSEPASEETSAEESQETTPEETASEDMSEEIVTTPQETKPNGGMMIETTEDPSWDLNSLLTNPMLLIVLVGAIVFVVLIIVIVGLVALFSRGKEEDDDSDDEEEEDNTEDDCEERSETVAEEVIVKDQVSPSVDVLAADESTETLSSEDDLDDDFEMLLEDDDDFDFLEF